MPAGEAPESRDEPGGAGAIGTPAEFGAAMSAYAAGVTLVTITEGRDDIGTTVSAFCPVSLDPPLVLVSLLSTSYPAELLSRTDRPGGTELPGETGPVDRFAVCLLAADQRVLAGRFAAAGRPSARRLLDGIPHRRGAVSGALIPDGGLAALECEVTQRVPAGDHLVVIARVLAVPYVAPSGDPLVRFRGRYPVLR
ncbi:MAG TPA: flavin reductase family protein [Streptosporangiaceae bacterium]|nr:flavin reductase family protein [Streptosporangiaceae bacterium]